MTALSTTWALARADVLERTRTYGFLVFTGLMLWLGYGTYAGHVHVSVGQFTGHWNSAWAGGAMALITNTFLTLVGFWFVRHSIERDARTRVGPILAATPLGRVAYVAGKALSHLVVLALMALVLFAAAALIQLARRSGAPLAPADLLAPYVIVVLPGLVVVAAFAVVFEATPVLRGPIGNAAWIFLWTFLLVNGVSGHGTGSDLFGVRAIEVSMEQAVAAQYPGAAMGHGLSVDMGSRPGGALREFVWHGLDVTPAFLASRLAWCALGLALVGLAAVPFHRFDPDRMPRLREGPELAAGASGARAGRGARARAWLAPARLPVPRGLVGAELRVLLAAAGPWWTLVAAGLWIATLVAPLPVAHASLLPVLWLWALPRWSSLGARDVQAGTAGLVFSAPEAARRVTLAGWAAGALLALCLALPVLVRLAGAGPAAVPAFVAIAAGAAFVPAFALASGAVSGSAKPFEAIYVMLWYVGPMNHVAAMDYVGATLPAPGAAPLPAGVPAAQPALWAALAALGIALAWFAQRRRLHA